MDGNGLATFVVHGSYDFSSTITVRRENNEVSVKSVDNDDSSQQVKVDDFGPMVPVVNGPELNILSAGAVWIIDAREDAVVIEGSCTGGL